MDCQDGRFAVHRWMSSGQLRGCAVSFPVLIHKPPPRGL
jgi:hypothetical protein